jgi:hypothetical protein
MGSNIHAFAWMGWKSETAVRVACLQGETYICYVLKIKEKL